MAVPKISFSDLSFFLNVFCDFSSSQQKEKVGNAKTKLQLISNRTWKIKFSDFLHYQYKKKEQNTKENFKWTIIST